MALKFLLPLLLVTALCATQAMGQSSQTPPSARQGAGVEGQDASASGLAIVDEYLSLWTGPLVPTNEAAALRPAPAPPWQRYISTTYATEQTSRSPATAATLFPETPPRGPLPFDIQTEDLPNPLPPPSGLEWLRRARSDAERQQWAQAEAAYRIGLDQLPPGGPLYRQGMEELAWLLDLQGRFFGVLDQLERLEETLYEPLPVRLQVLRATAQEALGRKVDAARTYVEALETGDDVERDEATARLRHVINRMDEEELDTFSALDPFSPEGGYASLRLARIALDEGLVEEAEPLLDRLDLAFTGEPIGRAARDLLVRIQAMRNVRPGQIGVLLPLTGPLAPFGKGALRGVLMGSELFTDTGQPLTLHIVDSGGDPSRAIKAVDELAMRGVVAIVGPLKGDASRAAARRAREFKVPIITLTPAADVVGEGVFRLHLREEDEIERLVEHAVNGLGLRRFALVVPNTELGRRYRMLFWDAAVARGAEIAGTATFSPGETNLKGPLAQVTGIFGLSRAELRERYEADRVKALAAKHALFISLGMGTGGARHAVNREMEPLFEFEPKPRVDFDGVFLPVSSLAAAQMAPQLPYYSIYDTTLLGIRSWNYATLTKVGKEYVRRARFPAEWHGQTLEGGAFLEAYKTTYGQLPGVMQAYAFDAIGLLVGANHAGQALDRETVDAYLSRLWSVPAVTGPLTTHPDGSIAATPKLFRVSNRQIVPVDLSAEETDP